MRILLAPLFLLLFVQAALAQYSQTATSNGATMRVGYLPPTSNGSIQAVLEINLEPEWITYWREPGAFGIPPQISLADPTQGQVSEIYYPIPKKIIVSGGVDIAYDEPVKIPFTVKLVGGQKANPVDLNVLIGVCHNICIPFQSTFTIDTSISVKDPAVVAAIDQAMNTLPDTPKPDFRVNSVAFTDENKTISLQLTVPNQTESISEVIIAGPAGMAFTKTTQVEISGTKAVVNVDMSDLPDDFNSEGQTWLALIRAGNRVVETPLTLPKS